MAELSPMMQQYFKIKDQNKDTILFFRLGDFYEMFFDDAVLASKELDLTLTGRDCGQDERAPMCGVPYHSSEAYIARLVAKGYKVAICEQVEDPATAKGLVKREVIRVITPGTVLENSMLDETKNSFITSVYTENAVTGICFCDISTGELFLTQIDDADLESTVKNELSRFSPREILIGGDTVNMKTLSSFIKEKLSAAVEMFDDDVYKQDVTHKNVLDQFGEDTLKQLIENGMHQGISSLSGLLTYLKNTQKTGIESLDKIDVYTSGQFMNLDFNTKKNLELLETMMSKEKTGSLLWVLDKTKTSMGKRLMRGWVTQPVLSCAGITKRQNAIDELVQNTILRMELSEALSGILDMQRTISRIVYGSANARELNALLSAIEKIPPIKEQLENISSTLLKEINAGMDTLEDIRNLVSTSIVDEPPFSVREGGMIKTGFNEELDSLLSDMNNSTELLTEIESREREKTGIPKLKISYNRVFGYYIEVSNSYKSMVPDSYVRKQTLSNCERYITQELKDLEGRILGAKERSMALEYKLFEEIRNAVSKEASRIQSTAKNIATLDVICSLANVAVDNNYSRPVVNVSDKIILKESRHPVVEKLLKDSPFVPNDVYLDCGENTVAIITGPNMAGKSTYMRQVAIIVLMAQMGSFVPAKSAEIGIVDSIFTRVGASDDLSSGQSTFMVEMTEVAHILKNATSKSLLILDEIGRGTSTFDGMSIARAVLEYTANKIHLGAKTLFATHYHELTEMEDTLPGVKNYNIAVKKRGDDITFLRRIVPGGADDSYGIEVAKLAGLPSSVIKNAKRILSELESAQTTEMPKRYRKVEKKAVQPSFVTELTENENQKVIDRINKLDVNTLTPIEAMNILFELKKMTAD